MRKGTDILGKAIVSYATGEKVGRVRDLIFDQDSNQLLALLVEESGWLSAAKVLPLESIQAIGQDAIIIAGEQSIIRANHLERVKHIVDRNNILKGTQILTMDGRNLGRMVDLYFDEHTGNVEGYEVSGGLFADAYSGRSFVPSPKTFKIGEDVAFVPSEVADLMQEQVGGIKAAMQSTGEKLQAASEEANARLQAAGRSATSSLTNAIVDPAEQKEFVVGKIVAEDIQTADGATVIARGQRITLADAQFAESQQVLDKLYRAVGGDVRQRVGEKLQASASNVNKSLTSTVVKPSEQKAYAIGKTTQWTVIAPNGESIAVSGQTVTSAIADLAERQGVLTDLYRATGGHLGAHLSARANGLLASYGVEEARGRRVQQMIRGQEGMIVAAPGQIVTDLVVDRAKQFHREAELLSAVGLSPSQAIRSNASRSLASTQDRLDNGRSDVSQQFSHRAEQVQNQAQSFWEQVKAKASELQGRSAKAVEEQRIRGALGRPVNRVILDQQDNVILNLGDLITHQAIDLARQSGVLDVLLSSVYTGSPDFTKEELRAPKPSMAALKPANQINGEYRTIVHS